MVQRQCREKAKDLELQKPFTPSGAHMRGIGYRLNILNLIASFKFLTTKDGEITRACQIQSFLIMYNIFIISNILVLLFFS